MPFEFATTVHRVASAIAVAAAWASPALAQQQFVGRWSCEFSYTEYANNGQRSSGFTMAFGSWVQPDGSFYAEGQEQNIMGLIPFRAQGTWQTEQGPNGPAFVAKGQKQDPTGISPFGYIGFMGPDNRSLYHSYDAPNTQTGRIFSRSSTGCSRTG